jgi:uncharacterized damage-inducible protein DinB
MVTGIQDLYEYNRWANRRLLAVTARLTPAQLGRDLGSSFPSVHDTLVHMLYAEWIWLSRWEGTSRTGIPVDWDLSTHEAILGAWGVVESELAAFVSDLTDERLQAPLRYTNTQGTPFSTPLVHLMRHVVNHASYHRGQIVSMLRQLGVEPVATDMVLFYLERGGQV